MPVRDAGPQFQEIRLDGLMERIRAVEFPELDRIVAIARGGVLPGYLVSRWLDLPLDIVTLRFRDDAHRPLYDRPRHDSAPLPDCNGERVLLADDVANSGATLRCAAELLPGAQITTLVISGTADISLFGPHEQCIRWPWSRE